FATRLHFSTLNLFLHLTSHHIDLVCPLLLFFMFYFSIFFFFFNDTATTEIYTLSLHDALPIYLARHTANQQNQGVEPFGTCARGDRKSTRLNSSHLGISYAVFCLKKKKKKKTNNTSNK